MIYSLLGKLTAKKSQFIVLETNGIGFKIFISDRTLHQLPKIGSRLKLFCHTHIRQDGIEIYGFLTEKELEIFELLNSIGGVGPKTALRILGAVKIEKFLAAVGAGKTELLTKISQVGKKTAQRIVLELTGKIESWKNEEALLLAETDIDIETALKNLGYKKNEIREAIKYISPKIKTIEERLKIALKFLAK
ncbi:MAG: Holliday junction branch migration protein RuvA [Patescibacteria group bacterium]